VRRPPPIVWQAVQFWRKKPAASEVCAHAGDELIKVSAHTTSGLKNADLCLGILTLKVILRKQRSLLPNFLHLFEELLLFPLLEPFHPQT